MNLPFSLFFILLSIFRLAVGDQAHTGQEGGPADQDQQAESPGRRYRVEAEVAFKNRDYLSAIKWYNKLIKIDKSSESYHSRAMVYLVINNFKKAFVDLDRALDKNPQHIQSLFFRAKTNKRFGRCIEALTDFRRILQLEPEHSDTVHQLKEVDLCVDKKARVDRFREREDCNGAIPHLDVLLEVTSYEKDNNLFYSRCMMDRGDYQASLKYAGNVLRGDDGDLDSLLLRGIAYYHLNDIDRAMKHWKQGLKMDPEHRGLKKQFKFVRKYQKLVEKAERQKKSKEWDDALESYTLALEVDPSHAGQRKFVNNERCATAIRYFRYDKEKRVEFCLAAKDNDPDAAVSYFHLGKAYEMAQDWDKAKFNYDQAVRKDPHNGDYRQRLQDAEFELKKARRKDYYAILGVQKHASSKQLKKGFRRCGVENHPDKCGTEECNQKFKDCVEGHEILSDPEKRRRYDNGHDVLGDMQNSGGRGGGHPFHGGFPFHGGGQHFHFRRG